MNRILEILKNKDLLLLWLAQLISQFGDRINQMALIGLIASRSPGSTVGLAKLLSFTIIPVFIVGPIAGVYVDRWNRRTTLIVCDILRGLLVLTIPFFMIATDSMVPIYIAVFLVFCLSRFYVPAKMSIIPDLVDKKDLLAANSLVSVTGMIAFVLGCALGGWIVEKAGSRGGFVWDSLTFFISGILLLFISPISRFKLNRQKFISTSREVISEIKKSVIQEIKEGFQYLTGHRDIRFILGMLFILFSAAGAIYVVIIVFIQESFNSVTKDLAILAVVLGIGLFLGAMIYGRFGEKLSRIKTIFFCLLTGGLILISFAIIVQKEQNIFVAGGLALILGMITGPIIIAANTIVHQVSAEQMRGKVFSGLEIVIHLAFLISMLLSSWLSEFINRGWILIGVGIIFSLVGIVGFFKFKNGRLKGQIQ